MRWYTCTPVPFGGGPDFFARDSGLLCKGFQALGIESKAVMPTPVTSGDEPDLIRTPPSNLESADWWRSQELDGVVLYAWGRPRYRKVARAIRDAGIYLILNQDAGGYISPREGLIPWGKMEWRVAGASGSAKGKLRCLVRVVRGVTIGLIATDPLRARHLNCGNIIASVCPVAADRFKRLCFAYGGESLRDRVRVIPHPVESEFRYQGKPKERRVVCIARWGDVAQKRPDLMVSVISRLVSSDDLVGVDIVGELTEYLQTWHSGLEPDMKSRVLLHGKIPREKIVKMLELAQVFYSSSAFESFGIAAAEALCSGCSVLAERSIAMPSFEWFVSDASGKLCDSSCAESHVNALRQELSDWESGRRDAAAIAKRWGDELHAPSVARKILALQGETRDMSKPPA